MLCGYRVDVLTSALHLCGIFFQKTITPIQSLKKKGRQTQFRGHFTRYLTILLKTVKVMKNKERQQKLSQTRRDWKDINKCNVIPWNGSGIEKGY